MVTFTARYHGTCAACGEHVNPGDVCSWIDDDIVHTDCDGSAPKPERPVVVCDECWMAKPCWCEE